MPLSFVHERPAVNQFGQTSHIVDYLLFGSPVTMAATSSTGLAVIPRNDMDVKMMDALTSDFTRVGDDVDPGCSQRIDETPSHLRHHRADTSQLPVIVENARDMLPRDDEGVAILEGLDVEECDRDVVGINDRRRDVPRSN